MNAWIDLGHDHSVRFYGWNVDRRLNSKYRGIPKIAKAGLIVRHPNAGKNPKNTEKWCESSIWFETEETRRVLNLSARPSKVPTWTVHSLEPSTLHIEPSLLCDPRKGGCGDHGYIRNGQWIVVP